MIRINLLPPEERVSARRVSFPGAATLLPAAAILVTVAAVGATAAIEHTRLGSLRADVDQLAAEVREIQPQVDRVKRLTAQREELTQRLAVIRQLDEGRFLSVRVMDNMSRELPQYLWLTSLTQQGESRVSIRGVTFSNLIVAELMKRLDASAMFSAVDLNETRRGEIDGRGVVEFDVNAALTPGETPSDLSAKAFLEEVLEEEEN